MTTAGTCPRLPHTLSDITNIFATMLRTGMIAKLSQSFSVSVVDSLRWAMNTSTARMIKRVVSVYR